MKTTLLTLILLFLTLTQSQDECGEKRILCPDVTSEEPTQDLSVGDVTQEVTESEVMDSTDEESTEGECFDGQKRVACPDVTSDAFTQDLSVGDVTQAVTGSEEVSTFSDSVEMTEGLCEPNNNAGGNIGTPGFWCSRHVFAREDKTGPNKFSTSQMQEFLDVILLNYPSFQDIDSVLTLAGSEDVLCQNINDPRRKLARHLLAYLFNFASEQAFSETQLCALCRSPNDCEGYTLGGLADAAYQLYTDDGSDDELLSMKDIIDSTNNAQAPGSSGCSCDGEEIVVDFGSSVEIDASSFPVVILIKGSDLTCDDFLLTFCEEFDCDGAAVVCFIEPFSEKRAEEQSYKITLSSSDSDSVAAHVEDEITQTILQQQLGASVESVNIETIEASPSLLLTLTTIILTLTLI